MRAEGMDCSVPTSVGTVTIYATYMPQPVGLTLWRPAEAAFAKERGD
jgi:hypothetical protein